MIMATVMMMRVLLYYVVSRITWKNTNTESDSTITQPRVDFSVHFATTSSTTTTSLGLIQSPTLPSYFVVVVVGVWLAVICGHRGQSARPSSSSSSTLSLKHRLRKYFETRNTNDDVGLYGDGANGAAKLLHNQTQTQKLWNIIRDQSTDLRRSKTLATTTVARLQRCWQSRRSQPKLQLYFNCVCAPSSELPLMQTTFFNYLM